MACRRPKLVQPPKLLRWLDDFMGWRTHMENAHQLTVSYCRPSLQSPRVSREGRRQRILFSPLNHSRSPSWSSTMMTPGKACCVLSHALCCMGRPHASATRPTRHRQHVRLCPPPHQPCAHGEQRIDRFRSLVRHAKRTAEPTVDGRRRHRRQQRQLVPQPNPAPIEHIFLASS